MTEPDSHFNPLTRFQSKGRSLNGIYSVKEFQAILGRERARSDRTGGRLSLIIFDMGDRNTDQTAAFCLAHVLTQRMRSIDEVGWFDTWRLGIVLPDTPAEGASKLANDICEKFTIKNKMASPIFKIYTYPSDWLPGFKDNPPNHPSVKTDPYGNVPPTAQSGKAKILNCNSLMERLEPLLVKQMPAWKRGTDILGSVFGLVLLFPVFLLISIVIKIVSPGPVFFKQKRVGYLGKPFNCLKFRTMHPNANSFAYEQHLSECINSDNPFKKLDDDDSRIMPFGKLLRKTSLDEVPQLLNVLRGEMSLVGPRPDVPYSVQCYTQWHHKRFDAFPGLTGLWQASGKNGTTFKEMIRLDITYIQQISFWLDLKILLKTVHVIITQTFESSLKRKDEEHAYT
jgi:lipopolysaccharide/colanic/teichoic acid biosynthesis glycosyltransferase